MKLNALEFIVLLAIIICSALLVASCSHAQPIPADPQECCKRLKVRSTTLSRFERMCIGLAFLESRFPNDPKAAKNIKEGLNICKYVFAVKETT
jgi:hypothetical protein|tara:strand:- start:274 stop:555 length:282 start_codon:yes stop_codon:yes gene_type:complete